MIFEKTNVSQETFEEKVTKAAKEIVEILVKKNKDYGGASFDLGLVGNYTLVHNKENRLRSLIENYYSGEQPNFEGIEDTYRDLIGYSLIGMVIFDTMQKDSEEKTGGQLLNAYAHRKDRGTSFAIQADREDL